MVLEIYDREAMGEVGPREIAQINQALIAELGEGGAMTPAEIARVLVDEELPVRFEQIFAMAAPVERYQRLFDRLLSLDTLAEAESSISRLDRLCRKFERASDRTGLRLARKLAIDARDGAERRASDERRSESSRAAHSEIAAWLTVWLQTPDAFPDWLELRKSSASFKRTFP
jgi:hypothetical protein